MAEPAARPLVREARLLVVDDNKVNRLLLARSVELLGHRSASAPDGGVAHVVRCIELGADDSLHKPVNPVLLKARIDSSLEKKRLRDQYQALIRRFATTEVAQDLMETGFALGGRRVQATVMFSDIRGFTAMVESQSPEESIELLNTYYTLMFEAISAQGGVVNQMIGDGLMAIFGAPRPLSLIHI